MTVEYLDRPAAGWFVLDVMRENHASGIGLR